MCIEAKVCASDACRGEDISRMTSIPEVGMQKALIGAVTTGNSAELSKILETQFWIDFYSKDGQSALIKASAVAQTEAMKELISRGADVNLQDAKGNTSLHALASTLSESSAEALSTLIKAGADLETKNALGETALLIAGKNSNLSGVKLMILAGANKNALDNNGEGLMSAFTKKGDSKAVSELVQMGVNPLPDTAKIVQN
jgi:ankyrin repeat protein